jgi:hypothetical protein
MEPIWIIFRRGLGTQKVMEGVMDVTWGTFKNNSNIKKTKYLILGV